MTEFGISTRWNAHRHTHAESMVDEILALGVRRVELGYNIRSDFVPAIKRLIQEKIIHVDSVHNYCPVPAIASAGDPELFTMASPDRRVRDAAHTYTAQTIRFAAEIGAKIVVVHCGNVDMKALTPELAALCRAGKRYSNTFEQLKYKLVVQREKRVSAQLANMRKEIERLIPLLQETKIRLGMENLPSWEAIPTEQECLAIIKEFGAEHLCSWHDFGHGQIRENLGLSHHRRSLESLSHVLGGVHIHDVIPPATDHVMPPAGSIDFTQFRRFVMGETVRILEPSPHISSADVADGLRVLREAWFAADSMTDNR